MSYSEIKTKRKKSERGVVKSALLSLSFGIFAFIAVLSISSILILNISIQSEYLYLFVLAAAGFSALVEAIIMCMFIKNKRLIFGLGLSASLSVCQFLILLCFNNASLSNTIYILFPIVIFCGFIGCVIGTNIKKK